MSGSRYLERPVTQLRRKDRGLDDEAWMDRLLATAAFGHLAIAWQGQPLLHGNLYWYDGERAFWHTAAVGKLRAVLDLGETPACFSVAEHGRMLPADTPFEFSTEYASVLLYGTVRVVPERAEKRYALEGLMRKYAPHLTPGVDYTPMPDSDIDQTGVYALHVTERVGKHNVKPADYPAYPYPAESFIDAERAAGRVTLKAKELA
jgi:nitroimidazol reductase NimA-like FMN-containing flavoprotein (pyridoxamine 5'-phosphate oxidase superfamily)